MMNTENTILKLDRRTHEDFTLELLSKFPKDLKEITENTNFILQLRDLYLPFIIEKIKDIEDIEINHPEFTKEHMFNLFESLASEEIIPTIYVANFKLAAFVTEHTKDLEKRKELISQIDKYVKPTTEPDDKYLLGIMLGYLIYRMSDEGFEAQKMVDLFSRELSPSESTIDKNYRKFKRAFNGKFLPIEAHDYVLGIVFELIMKKNIDWNKHIVNEDVKDQKLRAISQAAKNLSEYRKRLSLRAIEKLKLLPNETLDKYGEFIGLKNLSQGIRHSDNDKGTYNDLAVFRLLFLNNLGFILLKITPPTQA